MVREEEKKPQPHFPPPQPPAATQSMPLLFVTDSCVKLSAFVGCIPTVWSKSACIDQQAASHTPHLPLCI